MTTDRVDDVDDAVRSRCIATIRYETPSKPDAVRLRHLPAEQLGANLGDALSEELADAHPGASGRDIKELLKLTTRF